MVEVGKRGDSFYDVFPELEVEARAFAVYNANRKLQISRHTIFQILLTSVIMKSVTVLKLPHNL